MPLASNPLIQVTPGLMIWTIVCFLVTLYVLKRFAFGRVQQLGLRQGGDGHLGLRSTEARSPSQNYQCRFP